MTREVAIKHIMANNNVSYAVAVVYYDTVILGLK